MAYNNIKTTKRNTFISTLIIFISALSLFDEIISAFPFMINFILALFMLGAFMLYKNRDINFQGNLSIKYVYYMFGVPYFIFLIHVFRSIDISYILIFIFIILSTMPYICSIILSNTWKLYRKRSEGDYTFNDELTAIYNKRFEHILKNLKIQIYTFRGNENSRGIFTKNFMNKHSIYIDVKLFNMLDENEKDGILLHEIGHIFHKNYIAILVSFLIVFSLIFSVSSMLYFSATLNYLFDVSRTNRLIFNIFIFNGLIISIIFIKYSRKVDIYITESGQQKADYFALKYIRAEYLTSALRKITDYQEYMHPEYETFFEKYLGIRSNNIEKRAHIIIRRFK